MGKDKIETAKAEKVLTDAVNEKETVKVAVETAKEIVKEEKKATKKPAAKKAKAKKEEMKVNITLELSGESFDVDEFIKATVAENKNAKDVHFYFNMNEKKVYAVVDGVPMDGVSLF